MTAKVLCKRYGLSQAGGGGGYSRFQVAGMIEWRQKSNPKISLGLPTKPKKIHEPKFNTKQITCRISEP